MSISTRAAATASWAGWSLSGCFHRGVVERTAAHHGGHRRCRGVLGDLGEHRQKLLLRRRPLALQFFVEAARHLLVEGPQVLRHQGVLRREALVEGPRRDLSQLGQGRNAGGVDAVLVEQLGWGPKDELARTAAAAALRGGRLGFCVSMPKVHRSLYFASGAC
nr:hypothetical protein [Streptomyces wedmorensis]